MKIKTVGLSVALFIILLVFINYNTINKNGIKNNFKEISQKEYIASFAQRNNLTDKAAEKKIQKIINRHENEVINDSTKSVIYSYYIVSNVENLVEDLDLKVEVGVPVMVSKYQESRKFVKDSFGEPYVRQISKDFKFDVYSITARLRDSNTIDIQFYSYIKISKNKANKFGINKLKKAKFREDVDIYDLCKGVVSTIKLSE